MVPAVAKKRGIQSGTGATKMEVMSRQAHELTNQSQRTITAVTPDHEKYALMARYCIVHAIA